MRHNKGNPKLGRETAQRVAMLQNQVNSLLADDAIQTTEVKAKATKRMAEKIITIARKGDLHSVREVRKIICRKDAFKRLYSEYVPRFKDRPGGYCRNIKLGARRGDGAPMVILTWVE
jgi:large subunit ribosomal protein L17